MVNPQVLQGNWNEVKDEIMTKWGQLTDQDMNSFKGTVAELVGLIQTKTGIAHNVISRELDKIIAGGAALASNAAESVRVVANKTSERLQDGYEQAAYQADEYYQQAESMVKTRPMESIGVVFGAGVAVGVLVGLALRR